MSLMGIQNSLNRSEKGKTVCTARELAALFNLTVMRISQLRQEGMPVNNINEYVLSDCVAWYIRKLQARLDENQNQTIVAEKLKMYRAKAEMMEIEVSQRKGKSISSDALRRDMMKIFFEIKESFLSFAGRFSFELEDKKAGYIKNFLNKKVLEELNNIANKLELGENEK